MENAKDSKIGNALHKLFGTTKGKGLQPKEAMSYSLAGLGQNLIVGLVGSFLVFYFTEGLLLAPMVVGWIMLGVRLFDAFTDPIMGSVVDRTKTRFGKCRPYLMWAPIPILLLTVILFLNFPDTMIQSTTPSPGGDGFQYFNQNVFTIITLTGVYILWSVAYTIIDVPYWGLATSMTNETHQRGTILTVARLFCTIGAGAVTIFLPILTGIWTNEFRFDYPSDSPYAYRNGMFMSQEHAEQAAALLRSNFWWLALIICLLALPTFYLCFKNTKERYFNDKDVRSLKENLKLLFKNKPLGWITLSGVLGSGRTLFMFAGIFFARYVLGAEGLFTVITVAIIPGGLLATVLLPFLTKKFGKRKTTIYTHLVGGAALLIAWAIGTNGRWQVGGELNVIVLVVALIALVISGLPQGIWNITSYAMIADTVDYLELKTGQRAEGICFSVQTFINKIGLAVGAVIAAWGLGWANISPIDVSSQTIADNLAGLDLLFTLNLLVPALCMLAATIPLFFYKFNEKEQAAAVDEIMKRKGIDKEGNKLTDDKDSIHEGFILPTSEDEGSIIVESVEVDKDSDVVEENATIVEDSADTDTEENSDTDEKDE